MGGENLGENKELEKAIIGVFVEIAQREREKAIKSNDYATAFVVAIIEGMLKEAEVST